MRCLMCGAEMMLIKVVEDRTMMVPGFQHQTFMCSACYDVEHRFTFNKPRDGDDSAPMTEVAAPPVVPAPAPEEEPTAGPRLLRRVLAGMRGR